MHRLTIYFSGLALFFISCSPEPIFRLQPQADNTTFDRGVEYVHFEENGVALTISYYQHVGNQFIMDVEIANETDSLLWVSPQQFSYKAYEQVIGEKPDSSAEAMASRRAINPEQELLKTDMRLSEQEAAQRTDALIHTIGQVASVAASVAADTPEEREQLREDRRENYVRHEIRQDQREFKKHALRDMRKVWELDALRKTDLFPGEYIRGYLFFENTPDAQGYTIRYDSEKASFDLFFFQWKYEEDDIAD